MEGQLALTRLAGAAGDDDLGVEQASSGSPGLMEIGENWTRSFSGVPAALVTSVPSGVWLRRRRPAGCC